jgi:hypothetical protein
VLLHPPLNWRHGRKRELEGSPVIQANRHLRADNATDGVPVFVSLDALATIVCTFLHFELEAFSRCCKQLLIGPR